MPKQITDEWDSSNIREHEHIVEFGIEHHANYINDLKMEYIRPYLHSKDVIVEVGAGSGALLTFIGLENREEYTVVGVDFLSISTKIIKTNLQKFNLNRVSIRGNAYALPFKDNSVNMVISGGLLEHFREEEAKIIISEMTRILKKDGIFYSDIVPGKPSLCRLRIREHFGGYENEFPKKKWRELLLKNGRLSNIKIFSGLVIPPNFFFYKSGSFKLHLMYKIRPFIKSLDNTLLSDILGFVYFVLAKKK
jgi:ubiquinone/menaquinone biosynthesis C-methylase UbiE